MDVSITPSAERDAFPSGYNEWRERIEARVEAPARDGEANRALCQLVAETLGVDETTVGIERGHTSRQKTLVVHGVGSDEVRKRLGDVLET